VNVGANAMVGAGAVVTKSVPPNAIVVGNPAKIVGYVNASKSDELTNESAENTLSVVQTAVKGVTLHTLPVVTDIRGSLSVGEFSRSIPLMRSVILLFMTCQQKKLVANMLIITAISFWSL
jgi:hypothetical protein